MTATDPLARLEPGYYAVPDPDDPQAMTYWRRVLTVKRSALIAWPAKAWYGPAVPRKADVPTDPAARTAFAEEWSARRRTYLTRVIAAITVDPIGAAQCYAKFSIRCANCGRQLTDDTSKTVGIGPECRRRMDPAALARYATPRVGRAHVAHLNAERRHPR